MISSLLRHIGRRRAALSFIAAAICAATTLQAQETSAWQNTLAALSDSDALLPSIAIPSGVLGAADTTAAGQFARAGLLLGAADMARHNLFPDRCVQLLTEAEASLQRANQMGLSGHEASECAYLLGYLAERIHNNLTSAASFYQQAVSENAANQQAQRALARVQLYQARAAAAGS